MGKFHSVKGAKLNDRQKMVVESLGGHQLVIASAGSGKTKTLVHRVAALVSADVDPERILLLTFTRKAADEMKERVTALIGDSGEDITCGTFHSFALMLLRKFHEAVKIPRHFSILDDKDEQSLVDMFRNDMGLNASTPQPRTIMEIYGLHINTGKEIQKICEEKGISNRQTKGTVKMFVPYMKYKQANAMLNFDDMLYYLELMLRDTTIRDRVSNRYKYVLVDEYQDTNWVQSQIVKHIASKHHNIMAVGDEAQSIYKFRGADYENIMKFPKDFDNCEVIKLEQNYRSTKPILALANAVSQSFVHKFEKEMFTVSEGGSKPVYYRASDEMEQAQYVASKIQEAIRNGTPPHECAVLFRANSSALLIESQLDSMRIPYYKAGDRSLFDKAHIRDLLAYLKVCYYPTDTVAWSRVLHMHPGVGSVTATKIISEVIDNRRYISALKDYKGTKNEDTFKALYKALRSIRNQEGPVDALNIAFSYYRQFFSKLSNTPARLKDIEFLLKKAKDFASCRKMLTDIALNPSVEKEFNGVVLSTVHSAKGLEWDSVWIINVTDAKFPNSYFCKSDEELEEERRLFYVAITRAKKKLTIVAPMSDEEASEYLAKGYVENSHESPFMTENPQIDKLVRTQYSGAIGSATSRSPLSRRLRSEYE